MEYRKLALQEDSFYNIRRLSGIERPAGDFNGDGINDILFHAGMAAGGSYGHVFVFSGDTGLVVDIENHNNKITPDGFKLSYNYPNPFNSSTIFKYEIPYRTSVDLSIYDILGRKIKTLIRRELPAGSYQTSWDGRGETGNPVPSGVYLYRLKTTSTELSRKMILLK